MKAIAATVGALGLWAGLDHSAQGKFALMVETTDSQRTGWLLLSIVAGYFFALWATRNWGQTDREYYRGELQKIHVEHQSLITTLLSLTDDSELDRFADFCHQQSLASANFIREEMGESAFSKFVSGTINQSFPWPGSHSQDAAAKRSSLIGLMNLRLANTSDLLAAGTWDDPRPLHARTAAKRWKQRKERIWTAAKSVRALTHS